MQACCQCPNLQIVILVPARLGCLFHLPSENGSIAFEAVGLLPETFGVTPLMAIKKDELTSHYACVPNATLQDPRLTPEALGVLVFLLSLPEDWIIRAAQIRRQFNIGKFVQQRIFRELERAGYLVKEKEKDKARTKEGRWKCRITIFQTSQKPLTDEDGQAWNSK